MPGLRGSRSTVWAAASAFPGAFGKMEAARAIRRATRPRRGDCVPGHWGQLVHRAAHSSPDGVPGQPHRASLCLPDLTAPTATSVLAAGADVPGRLPLRQREAAGVKPRAPAS